MTKLRITAAAAGAILTAAVLLSGCGASGDNAKTSTAGAGAPNAPQAGSGKAKSDTGAGSSGKAAPDASAQPSVTRSIIKTGSLTVEAADVDKERQAAIAVATGLRGQVSSEDTGSSTDGGISRADLVLMVPTASFETAIQRLSSLGKRTQIHQESSDVTEQVVDVNSRITTQRASLTRMRVLLEKATTIGEIVTVETELTRREADLESLLAKQKALAGQTEMATLNLSLVEPGKAPVQKSDNRGFLAGLSNGWDAFTTTMSTLLTVIGTVLPFLIALALIGVPLWLLRHRFRRTPTPVPATAGPPLPQHPDHPGQS
ncbi:MAG: hypothetical protein QOH50_2764 [Kribbellaceae bacterium]|nr:hypothetical protein [Kribbellaceae bacterium]